MAERRTRSSESGLHLAPVTSSRVTQTGTSARKPAAGRSGGAKTASKTRSKASTRKSVPSRKVAASSKTRTVARPSSGRRLGRLKPWLLASGALASGYTTLALIGYHSSDPGFSRTGSGEAENMAGPVGALVADVMLQVFGWGAALVLPAGLAMVWKLAGRPVGGVLRVVGALAGSWAGLSLLALVMPVNVDAPFPPSGLLGLATADALTGLVGPAGAWLLSLATLGTAIVAVWRVDIEKLADRGVSRIERDGPRLGRFGWLVGRRAVANVASAAQRVGSSAVELLEREPEEYEDEVDSMPGLEDDPSAPGVPARPLVSREPAVGLIPRPTVDERGHFSGVTPARGVADGQLAGARTHAAMPQLAEVEWEPTQAGVPTPPPRVPIAIHGAHGDVRDTQVQGLPDGIAHPMGTPAAVGAPAGLPASPPAPRPPRGPSYLDDVPASYSPEQNRPTIWERARLASEAAAGKAAAADLEAEARQAQREAQDSGAAAAAQEASEEVAVEALQSIQMRPSGRAAELLARARDSRHDDLDEDLDEGLDEDDQELDEDDFQDDEVQGAPLDEEWAEGDDDDTSDDDEGGVRLDMGRSPGAPPPSGAAPPRAQVRRAAPELSARIESGNLVSGGDESDGIAVIDAGGETPFELPHLGLLDFHLRDVAQVDEVGLRNLGRILEEKLADFGVKGEVRAIRPGPVITTFEYLPAPGIKISKIAGLSDDIAMALKALRVRIVAPIPGKGVVGIEIPNKTRQTVWIRDILAADSFRANKMQLPMALGKSVEGKPSIVDLAKMPHLLVGGTTGSGKSVGINAMLLTMLYARTPDELKFIMIDPKMLEFELYQDIPHLLHPVVTEPKLASAALKWACEEMDNRYRLLARWKTRNIISYNKRVEKELSEWSPKKARQFRPRKWDDEVDGEYVPEKLPYIVVVIDELADLMMAAAKDVEESIIRLAQKARAAGIHLIVATQRPSVNVITGLIKANMPSRISFQVRTKVDARTILDQNGSENLLGMGDMLYLPPGVAALERCHGPFVSDEEARRVTDFLREQAEPDYGLELDVEEEGVDGVIGEDEYDELYDEALSFVASQGKASTSMVQRRFKIGYNRAARIIDILEREGVVGPADGARPRKVLVPALDD